MLKQIKFSVLIAAFCPAVVVATPLAFSPVFAATSHAVRVVARTDATGSAGRTGLASAYAVTNRKVANQAADAPELPLLDVDFCGECLPLDQDGVIDRWKHVFTLFRNSTNATDLGSLRERADAFFPIIEPILAKYDIPDDFRYIPLAESGLNPRAVSRAGAAGYWQLMPGTARALGLKVGGRTDERFNVRKATEAACRYLRELYDELGSWSLVAAAYNAGPGYLKNQIRRTNHRDYYRMSLPRETRYYLFRILVYKEVLSRPGDYASFLSPVGTAAQES